MVIKIDIKSHERIIRILQMKFKKFNEKDKSEVMRIALFFLRRGFFSEDIAKAFREYKDISIE